MCVQVGNIHGNEVVGRQLILYTISHLIQKNGADPRVTRLLNTTDIFFLPSMNPDGFVKAQVSFFFAQESYLFNIFIRLSRKHIFLISPAKLTNYVHQDPPLAKKKGNNTYCPMQHPLFDRDVLYLELGVWRDVVYSKVRTVSID